MTKKTKKKLNNPTLSKVFYFRKLLEARQHLAALESERVRIRERYNLVTQIIKRTRERYQKLAVLDTAFMMASKADLTLLNSKEKLSLEDLKAYNRNLYEKYKDSENSTDIVSAKKAIDQMTIKCNEFNALAGEYEVTLSIVGIHVGVGNSQLSLFDFVKKYGEIQDSAVTVVLRWTTYVKQTRLRMVNLQTFHRIEGRWWQEIFARESLREVQTDKPYMHFPSKALFLSDLVKNSVDGTK